MLEQTCVCSIDLGRGHPQGLEHGSLKGFIPWTPASHLTATEPLSPGYRSYKYLAVYFMTCYPKAAVQNNCALAGQYLTIKKLKITEAGESSTSEKFWIERNWI